MQRKTILGIESKDISIELNDEEREYQKWKTLFESAQNAQQIAEQKFGGFFKLIEYINTRKKKDYRETQLNK